MLDGSGKSEVCCSVLGPFIVIMVLHGATSPGIDHGKETGSISEGEISLLSIIILKETPLRCHETHYC
jgi:hypothetical protein